MSREHPRWPVSLHSRALLLGRYLPSSPGSLHRRLGPASRDRPRAPARHPTQARRGERL